MTYHSGKQPRRRFKRDKLVFNSYIYTFERECKGSFYFRCQDRRCAARAIKYSKSQQVQETQPHSCATTSEERAKDAAIERLREMTLSVEGSVKAIELVRKVLRDLSPEVRSLMPSEDALIHRVKRWARSSNISLVKAAPEDYLIPEGEEPLAGYSGVKASDSVLDSSSVSATVEDTTRTSSKEVVKTGVVYLEPVSGFDECEDKKPSGLIYLKGMINGHYRAVIDGQPYSWKRNLKGGKLLYACREAELGCSVTVIVDNDQKKYELRGSHEHENTKKDKRSLRCRKYKTLKRVDEDGNEIGVATLDDFVIGSIGNREEYLGQSTAEQDAVDDENDCLDLGGDDFQIDFEPEVEVEQTSNKQPTPVMSRIKSPIVITTSSKPGPQKPLFKACCYLNVKSEGEWFPRGGNSKFYSFFKKVETVEKRIADAEIVDNWMAEAPRRTVVRFEGFRKQVMINYRNKLKLRREIRFGRKIGSPLAEINPFTSAHMFAKDPSHSDATCTISPDNFTNTSSNAFETIPVITSEREPVIQETPRRTRGRPKSKKTVKERENLEAPAPIPVDPDPTTFDDSSIHHDNNDDGFQHEFDDSQDAMSVTSEKEIKFWEDDPSKLVIEERREKRQTPKKKYVNDEEFNDSEDKDIDDDEWNDESDPDYDENESDDEDWGSTKKKKKRYSKTLSQPFNSGKVGPTAHPEKPSGPREIVVEDKTRRKKKTEPPKPKPVKASHSYNIKFPDAVLTKDGRVFMEGIEIIKNPPGAYKPRPYSVSYSCGMCGKITLGFWKIRQHICGHHLGMYKCHICHKEFADAKIISRHIIMAHGERQSQYEDCPICGKPVKSYKNEKTMRRHRWLHLNEEERKDPEYKNWGPPVKDPNKPDTRNKQSFMCGQCGKTFQFPTALRKHEQTHVPGYEVTLMCQYCGKIFNRRKGLSQHVLRCARKVQGHINLTTYPCPKCPTRFSTRATRSKHMRRFHSNVTNAELPFSCPKCPRSFGTRSGFRNHKRVCVDGEKGYNNKSASDPHASTSSLATTGYSVVKDDPCPTESLQNQSHSSVGSDNSQYGSVNTETSLGFNYNFMGGNNGYSQSQFRE